jgi:hypothetical protein
MLPPLEFGNYMATGTNKEMSARRFFFEVEPGFSQRFH